MTQAIINSFNIDVTNLYVYNKMSRMKSYQKQVKPSSKAPTEHLRLPIIIDVINFNEFKWHA